MVFTIWEKVPVLKDIGLFRKYAGYLASTEFKVDPLLWIILSIIFSLLAGIGAWQATDLLVGIEESPQIGALFFFVVIDLMIGYPYMMAQQRIDRIEEDLSDALRQIADTLKAGGTYEYALREVGNAEYGPLKKEIEEVLRKLEEGENFENSLKSLSDNVDSRLVKRTVTIIVDSLRAGAGLASVLEEISDDVRESHRLGKERKARTTMQVLFTFVAGGVVAPMIFGFVSTITGVLIKASQAAVSAEKTATAQEALEPIGLSIQAYIFIEAMATALMISIMREGKITKSIIYFPILIFIAYIVYIAAGLVSAILVGAIQ